MAMDAWTASASHCDNKIACRQCQWRWVAVNTTVVTASADGAYSVFAADIDGDGRMDLASASAYDDRLHGIAM